MEFLSPVFMDAKFLENKNLTKLHCPLLMASKLYSSHEFLTLQISFLTLFAKKKSSIFF